MMFKGTAKVPNDEFTRLSRIYGGTVSMQQPLPITPIIISFIPKLTSHWL